MPVFNLTKAKVINRYNRVEVSIINSEYKVDNYDSNLIWKKHPKYDIIVSNKGDIISFPNVGHNFYKAVHPSNHTSGYKQITIDKKKKYVHRIVAETFIPNINNFPEINHIDKDKTNNCVDNLEWCDKNYNISYSLSRKIAQVDIKTGNVIKIWDSANQAAKYYNGSNLNILNVCKRINRYNSAYGYFWRFADSKNTFKDNKCKKKINQIDPDTKSIINTFNSITEAAKCMNIDISAISAALNGKSKTSCGYIWKYENR